MKGCITSELKKLVIRIVNIKLYIAGGKEVKCKQKKLCEKKNDD